MLLRESRRVQNAEKLQEWESDGLFTMSHGTRRVVMARTARAVLCGRTCCCIDQFLQSDEKDVSADTCSQSRWQKTSEIQFTKSFRVTVFRL